MKMDCLVSQMLKEANYCWGNAHIRQEFHADASSRG